MRHDATLHTVPDPKALDGAGFGVEPGPAPCENEGCLRIASAGETLCETCGIEQALFRRDRRPPISGAPRAER